MTSFTDGLYTGLDCIDTAIESGFNSYFSRLDYEESVTLGARRADEHEKRCKQGAGLKDHAKYVSGLSLGLMANAFFFPYVSVGFGVYDMSRAAKVALKGTKSPK